MKLHMVKFLDVLLGRYRSAHGEKKKKKKKKKELNEQQNKYSLKVKEKEKKRRKKKSERKRKREEFRHFFVYSIERSKSSNKVPAEEQS